MAAKQNTLRKDRDKKAPPLEVVSEAPKLDRLVHERLRLGILSALSVNESLTFNELKKLLDTTDGNLATGDLVLLSDDRHLQPAENVVPVIRSSALERYGKRLSETVNAVSAQLTSRALLFMDWRVEVAGNGVMAEARDWLERHRFLPRPG